MSLLPIAYIWLAIVAMGLLAAYIAGLFLGDDKGAIAGFSLSVGLAIGNLRHIADGTFPWWVIAIATIAGLMTLWWNLFRFKWMRN